MTNEDIVAEYHDNDVDVDYYREGYMLPNADSEEERERIKNMSDEEVMNKAVEDRLYWEQKWEDFVRQMGRLLRDISQRNKHDGYFVVTTNNAGWRDQRGGKVIDVSRYDLENYEARYTAAEEFIRTMTLDGGVSFEVERERNRLYITRYHHDAPTGETFRVRPLKADEVRQYDREGESAILESHKESGVHP